MKRLVPVLLASLIFIIGCPQPAEDSSVNIGTISGNVTRPGSTTDLSQAFLVALNCASGQIITWSYPSGDALGVNYLPSRDGQITQNGIFSAPACGSSLVGTTVQVQASCRDQNNVNHVGTAAIAVSQDLLNSLSFGAAAVSICGAPSCLARTPTDIRTPLCTTGVTTIQYYASLSFTCGVFWNPADPPTVGTGAGQLPQCSAEVSP